MKYYIKDNAGSLIEVSDLQKSIMQVAAYLGHLHEQVKLAQSTADQLEQKYWKDLFRKLCLLREKVN